jgi:uncharacterized protein (UPF0303 family)
VVSVAVTPALDMAEPPQRKYRALMAADRQELDALLAHEEELQFAAFDHDTAWALGCAFVEAARRDGLAVTIDVRHGDQQVFHAALPGTSADNDAWVERKVRVVRRFGHSSFAMGTECRLDGTTLSERYLVDEAEYGAHGGAFPVIVRGTGPVGTVTVSGLTQAEDHRFVVETLRRFLAAG